MRLEALIKRRNMEVVAVLVLAYLAYKQFLD